MKIFTTRTFTWKEVGLLKVCLLSLGMIMGMYFYDYLVDAIWILWGMFVLTASYFVVRFVREQ